MVRSRESSVCACTPNMGSLIVPLHFTAAREWLEQYAEMHPSLKEALADESIQKHAKRLLRLWVRTFEQRVYDLRGSPAIVAQRNLSQLHRTGTEMMRALVMRHDTFRTFLSEPMDGLQHWQMFMILVSVVCSQLLVNIWCVHHGLR